MELNEFTDKSIDYIIGELIFGSPKLSKWEMDFIESIADQWERKHFLSDKQKEILGRIWEKV